MLIQRARVLIATLWVGSLWTVGYGAVPILFATIHDRTLAGRIAGTLFRAEAWLSICCGVLLVALTMLATVESNARQRKTALILICGMLTCTLAGYFGLQPYMAALREAIKLGEAPMQDANMQFHILHGISGLLYLIQSLLGAALIFKIR